MSNGEGFYKHSDKGYIQKGINDIQGIGERIFIRKVSGLSGGSPLEGIQPSLSYTTIKSTAIIKMATPEEITASAGIYQYGDLQVQLLEELKFSDDQTRDIGDRVIYKKQTYRIIGRTQSQNIENRDMYFVYIMRKVGAK